jgi:hypothetical protein
MRSMIAWRVTEQRGGIYMFDRHSWLYVLIVALSGFAGGLSAAQFTSASALAARHHDARVVTAEEFDLVDQSGNKRAMLYVTPRGVANLAMFDGEGNDRAEFRVARDGSSLLGFYDTNGTRRVVVGQSPSGPNGIAIYDNEGRPFATLSVKHNEHGSLTLYDPNTGQPRAGLGVASGGAPALVLFDKQGRDRLEVHIGADGNPGIVLVDANGKSIAGLPMH